MHSPATTIILILYTITCLNLVSPVEISEMMYDNWTTPEQREMDFAESIRYVNSINTTPAHVHAREENISTDVETRSFLSMESIFDKMCDNSSPDLTKLSESMHATISKGWCGVCIEKKGWNSMSTLTMNFKDVENESNWNKEELGRYARDCTEEKISGGRQLRMVQFFSRYDNPQCLCNIHITCHDGITHFERSWINISGSLMISHYNLSKLVKPQACPSGCIVFGPHAIKGMNVMRDALQCHELDDACKHKFIEMWSYE